LDQNNVAYRYREYTREPLSEAELKKIFAALGVPPRTLLRKADKAYKENKLTGKEPGARLIKLMARHPTLLQRPIGIKGKRVVLGRPIERLLELA
jgi:arsenate reductase